jgi:hypothetical protein
MSSCQSAEWDFTVGAAQLFAKPSTNLAAASMGGERYPAAYMR